MLKQLILCRFYVGCGFSSAPCHPDSVFPKLLHQNRSSWVEGRLFYTARLTLYIPYIGVAGIHLVPRILNSAV